MAGLLELSLLNTQMSDQGILSGCGLNFYTYSYAYNVTFGPFGSFQIERYNKFLEFWELVLFSGTLDETTQSLNMYGPFLILPYINAIWGSIVLPPVNPSGGIINPV